MHSGAVETLLILGGNPVYDAPADLNFLDALKKVKFRAHLGLYSNETAAWCHWHVPEAHYLESWSDARAYDGTASIVQPLIAPLYDGKTAHEVMNVLLNQADQIRARYRSRLLADAAQGRRFRRFLADLAARRRHRRNGVPGEDPPAAKVPRSRPPPRPPGSKLCFRPDPAVGDGAMSNNAWLQEMPKPQNKMTWDNAVWISPESAAALRRRRPATWSRSQSGGRKVDGPVWVLPGHADESMTVHFGYGRTRAGKSRRRGRLQRLRAAHHRRAVACRPASASTRKSHGYQVRHHAAHADHGGARSVPRRRLSPNITSDPEFARPEENRRRRRPHAVPAVELQPAQMGHVDRPDGVRRLPGVHDRVPGGKQHRRWWERRKSPRAAT